MRIGDSARPAGVLEDPMNEREAEIAQLEQVLSKLRSQQANLAWAARFLLPFCIIAGVLVACFLAYTIYVGSIGGIIVAIAILAPLGLLGYFAQQRHPGILQFLSANWDTGGAYPDSSQAQFFERRIAECEKRLSEIKLSK